MSTLISYAKAFGIATTQDMSQTEIATHVANHFVSNSIDENKVIHDFYTKTENVKRNPSPSLHESSSFSIPKRQPKRPKKYSQLEEPTCHYYTRSRTEKEEPVQYCICGKQDNEEMVECDNPNCKHQWFHYECVGIKNPDDLPPKWYCPECQELMKK